MRAHGGGPHPLPGAGRRSGGAGPLPGPSPDSPSGQTDHVPRQRLQNRAQGAVRRRRPGHRTGGDPVRCFEGVAGVGVGVRERAVLGDEGRSSPCRATSSGSDRSWLRLTAKTVTAPDSGSCIAVACSRGTVPYCAVSCEGESTRTSSTRPRPYRAAWANGWNVVWRQAGPPGSVRIGRDHVDQLGQAATLPGRRAAAGRSAGCRRPRRR